MREAITTHGRRIFKTVGDAFCAAFTRAPDAVAAAAEAQRSLRAEPRGEIDPLRVRMAWCGTAEPPGLRTYPAGAMDGNLVASLVLSVPNDGLELVWPLR